MVFFLPHESKDIIEAKTAELLIKKACGA